MASFDGSFSLFSSNTLGVKIFCKINYKYMKGWDCRKYTNKAGMKTQQDHPATEKIVVKKDYKSTLHTLPEYETDVE